MVRRDKIKITSNQCDEKYYPGCVKTLSSFYNSIENNVEINKILKNFSKDVYFNSYDQIVKKIFNSPIYFLKFQKKININLILDLFVIFLVLFILNNQNLKEKKKEGLEIVLLTSFLISLIPTLLIYIFMKMVRQEQYVSDILFCPNLH